MIATEFAPAKVNLFLHVGRPGADGRHPVCSLAVFADVADALEARPAETYSLSVTGPFAAEVGPVANNLISRALAAVGAAPMQVRLDKRLPVASGLGGGSSDAGAALRLARRLDPGLDQAEIEHVARALGADGLLCLRTTAAVAEGQGERLSAAPLMPPLPAVLVNPGVACPTGAVYRAYDQGPGPCLADRPDLPDRFESPEEVAIFLARQRNDLEAPAAALFPEIDDAVATLARQPDTLLARMSGSGATVFGLFSTDEAAVRAAREVERARPKWWVRACRLNRA